MPGGEVVPHRLRQLGAARADGALAAAVRLPESERAGEEEVAVRALGVEKEAFPVLVKTKLSPLSEVSVTPPSAL